MNSKSFRRKTGVAAAAVLCGAVAASALPGQAIAADTVVAQAPPPKGGFGPVQNLVADASSAGTGYRIDATWTALAGATKYTVSLVGAGGTVLQEATVTSPAWSVATSQPAGSQLGIKVVGVNDRNRKSRPATVAVVLPDVTAPHATYRTSSVSEIGMITQVSLLDDLSSPAQITREVNWGDGQLVAWPAGEVVTNVFPVEGMYHPEVKVTDQAGNARTYVLNLPIGDEEAPTGDFVANPGAAWVRPAVPVTVTQLALDDVFSKDADISRWVIWGDDTAPQSWTTGDTLAHVYTEPGVYAPVVRLTDEAGNADELPTSQVVVTADEVAPTSAVSRPQQGTRRTSKWSTVRGTAMDVDGTGVKVVTVRAIQERGQAWYAYKAPKAKWVKAGATRAEAVSKARPAEVSTTDLDTWSYRFGSLRKGKLLLTVWSVDRAGNISQPATVSQKLTRR